MMGFLFFVGVDDNLRSAQKGEARARPQNSPGLCILVLFCLDWA